MEVWLGNNRRALWMGMALPALLAAASLTGLWWVVLTGQHWALGLLFVALCAAPLWLLGELLYALAHPRLAYERGELLVYFSPTAATRVPIEIVECFFLGQGPSELPKLNGREPETSNVVVRLAESATDWKQREVRPTFGHWCEGYITIRGSWCEPIDRNLMQRLNQRLAEIQRQRPAAGEIEARP
ncbi:MAG: hypothetical protein WD872_01970 [Pirellulaceae bacterium]